MRSFLSIVKQLYISFFMLIVININIVWMACSDFLLRNLSGFLTGLELRDKVREEVGCEEGIEIIFLGFFPKISVFFRIFTKISERVSVSITLPTELLLNILL